MGGVPSQPKLVPWSRMRESDRRREMVLSHGNYSPKDSLLDGVVTCFFIFLLLLFSIHSFFLPLSKYLAVCNVFLVLWHIQTNSAPVMIHLSGW